MIKEWTAWNEKRTSLKGWSSSAMELEFSSELKAWSLRSTESNRPYGIRSEWKSSDSFISDYAEFITPLAIAMFNIGTLTTPITTPTPSRRTPELLSNRKSWSSSSVGLHPLFAFWWLGWWLLYPTLRSPDHKQDGTVSSHGCKTLPEAGKNHKQKRWSKRIPCHILHLFYLVAIWVTDS